MKLNTARNILSILWASVFVVLLLMLFIKTPQLGNDETEVWKLAPTFIAPILALVVSFLFGGHNWDKKQHVPNIFSFYVAILFSLMYIVALFIGLFFWSGSMLENIHTASMPLNYFSAITIMALNFFFIGANRHPPRDPKANHDH